MKDGMSIMKSLAYFWIEKQRVAGLSFGSLPIWSQSIDGDVTTGSGETGSFWIFFNIT